MDRVKFVPFEAKYAKEFSELNFGWLDKYFYIEDYDREVLTNPKNYILDKGGYIFMALVDDEVAGTVALINRAEEGLELSKLAVSPVYQGKRIGQKLTYYCINFAGEKGCDRIYLDSNTLLEPAIRLYKKVGFREIPMPECTPYARCNIRMELLI